MNPTNNHLRLAENALYLASQGNQEAIELFQPLNLSAAQQERIKDVLKYAYRNDSSDNLKHFIIEIIDARPLPPPLPPRKSKNPPKTVVVSPTLLEMPTDLLHKIFSYLPLKDLFRIPFASKNAKTACNPSHPFWKTLHECHFPARQRIAPPSDLLQACSDAYRTRRNFLAGQFTTSQFDGFVRNELPCFTASDGKLILSSNNNIGEFYIWDLKTGEYSAFSDKNLGSVTSLRAHDGKLYVGSKSKIAIWDLQANKYLSSLESNNKLVDLLEICDGMLCAGSTEGHLEVWDLKTGALLHSLEASESSITSFTAHNGKLYLGDSSGTIKIWDLVTGECLGSITQAHSKEVSSLVISGEKLYSGSPEITHQGFRTFSYGPIKIWDLKTFNCIGILTTKPNNEDRSSLFTFEGHLCSHSDDKISIWDLEKRQLQKTLYRGTKNIISVVPVDGKLCAITYNALGRRSIKVLDFTPQGANHRVCLAKVIPLKKIEPIQYLYNTILCVQEVYGKDLRQSIQKKTSEHFEKLPLEAQREICHCAGFSGNFDSEPERYRSLFYDSFLTQRQQLDAIKEYEISLLANS